MGAGPFPAFFEVSAKTTAAMAIRTLLFMSSLPSFIIRPCQSRQFALMQSDPYTEHKQYRRLPTKEDYFKGRKIARQGPASPCHINSGRHSRSYSPGGTSARAQSSRM
jgi:hypothetical protein